MAYRNDPSSLSFGARLTRAERDAADAKRELADLKRTLPNSRELQAAAISGEAIKNQRKAAKQMLGRGDASSLWRDLPYKRLRSTTASSLDKGTKERSNQCTLHQAIQRRTLTKNSRQQQQDSSISRRS